MGDVFLLGTHSWRIRRVTQGEVRVVDAEGAHPTIPFWVGEAPSRTEELSERGLRPAPRRRRASLTGRPARRTRSDRRRPAGGQRHVAERLRAQPADAAAQLVELPGRRPRRARRRSRPATTSSSSASSTRPAACSWSSTRPSAAGSTRASGWRCARGSAPPSTSSSRRRPTTTPSCSRSAPSTASPSTAPPGCCDPSTAEVRLAPGRAGLAHVRVPVALEPEPLPGRAALPGRQEEPPAHPAHGVRRPHGRGLPGPGRLPGERRGAARS